jgi:hypothetical protein
VPVGQSALGRGVEPLPNRGPRPQLDAGQVPSAPGPVQAWALRRSALVNVDQLRQRHQDHIEEGALRAVVDAARKNRVRQLRPAAPEHRADMVQLPPPCTDRHHTALATPPPVTGDHHGLHPFRDQLPRHPRPTAAPEARPPTRPPFTGVGNRVRSVGAGSRCGHRRGVRRRRRGVGCGSRTQTRNAPTPSPPKSSRWLGRWSPTWSSSWSWRWLIPNTGSSSPAGGTDSSCRMNQTARIPLSW